MGGEFDLVIYSLASPRRTDPSDSQVIVLPETCWHDI